MSPQSAPKRVAMITGAASGIGEATAIAFAKAGHDLVLTDLDAARLAAVRDAAAAAGATVAIVAGDIVADATLAEVRQVLAERFGRLDAAVNSAGISGPLMPAADYDEAAWSRTLAINLTAVWRCMRLQVAQMLAGAGGAIVNISSTAGLKGYRHSSAYSAAKHGVIGLTRSAAQDYAALGIRINAICPGYIRTPMTDVYWKNNPEAAAGAAQAQPLMRVGEAIEVAEAALWLCSDKAAFVVGAALAVDGGQIA